MGALNKFQEALSELISELTPGGMVRRAAAGSSPITPLLYFCAFAALVAMPIGVFSKNQWLQNAAFAVFAAVLGISVLVYLICVIWRRDLLRSEHFVLSSRNDEKEVDRESEAGPQEGSSPSMAKGEEAGVS